MCGSSGGPGRRAVVSRGGVSCGTTPRSSATSACRTRTHLPGGELACARPPARASGRAGEPGRAWSPPACPPYGLPTNSSSARCSRTPTASAIERLTAHTAAQRADHTRLWVCGHEPVVPRRSCGIRTAGEGWIERAHRGASACARQTLPHIRSEAPAFDVHHPGIAPNIWRSNSPRRRKDERPHPVMTAGRGSHILAGRVAGPSMTLPSAAKREPWSGQSQVSSASLRWSTPPRWLQIGRRNAPGRPLHAHTPAAALI